MRLLRSTRTIVTPWRAFACASAAILLAGCADDGGTGSSAGREASSPEQAVSSFLAPFARPVASGKPGESRDEQGKRAAAFWRQLCDHVDPAVRRELRFSEDARVDPRTNCGAVVALAVLYTGDTGEMAAPSAIEGTPLSATTDGDRSVVRVAVRYRARPGASTPPPPPAKATISVLTVKRRGSWWVATPTAFNPLRARAGGLSERELRAEHTRLLAPK
jgi:hypothetical protein